MSKKAKEIILKELKKIELLEVRYASGDEGRERVKIKFINACSLFQMKKRTS